MPRSDDAARIEHMLNAGLNALRFVEERSRSDLDTDEQLALSLVRLLEVLGEAANRVTDDTRHAITHCH